MSDDLRLPRRGIEPRPSGFRDIGSTSRPSPLAISPSYTRSPRSILVDTTVTDGHRRGKKLTAYKYPLTFPQMMAKPRLNVSFLSYVLVLIACSILCLVLPHHCPTCTISIDFWSLLFLQAQVHASPWAFWYSLDEINQNSFTTPNSLTISHHPLCMWNHPLTTPSFPLYPNPSQLNYQILYTFLWKPVKRRGQRWYGHPLSLNFSLYWS